MLAEVRGSLVFAMCLCDGGPKSRQYTHERDTCPNGEEGSPVDEPGIPKSERYLRMKNEHLITPCPACGLIDECPHTPIRCQHAWKYSTDFAAVGTERTCQWCGRVERAELRWATVVA